MITCIYLLGLFCYRALVLLLMCVGVRRIVTGRGPLL